MSIAIILQHRQTESEVVEIPAAFPHQCCHHQCLHYEQREWQAKEKTIQSTGFLIGIIRGAEFFLVEKNQNKLTIIIV